MLGWKKGAGGCHASEWVTRCIFAVFPIDGKTRANGALCCQEPMPYGLGASGMGVGSRLGVGRGTVGTGSTEGEL